MSLERPDRPGVVAVERSDGERAAVLRDEGRERGDADETDPARATPHGAVGLPKAPRSRERRRDRQNGQPDPAEAHVRERQIGRDDRRDDDSAQVRKPRPRDEGAPGAGSAEQWQHPEPRHQHQGVRAEKPCDPHRNR